MKRIITVYHGIGNSDKFMEVPMNMFLMQLKYLKRKKFNFCHFDEFINATTGNNIMIMFDDGLNSIKPAIEYLEQNSIKYSLAIIEDNIGKKGFLTELELKRLKYAQFYFHTKSHLDLSTLSTLVLKKELTVTKSYISKKILVYPMGKYNNTVKDEMSNSGFDYGMTVLPFHVNKSFNKQEIPRICINGYLNFNKYKLFVSKLGNIYLHLAFIKRKILNQNYLDR